MSYNPAQSHYGYSGQQPSQGYPGQNPSQGYPGQNPSQGYPGQNPPQGYPGQQPSQGYQGQQPSQGYQGQQQYQGYHGQQPSRVYPGQNPNQIDPTVASWFKAVDQDNSGFINSQELQAALQNGNRSNFSEEACRMMIAMFDTDQSGTINVEEFSRLFGYVNQWTDVYRRYDRDQSGTIDEGEMASALQQMGFRLSPQFVSMLIGKYGLKTRKMTLDNFIVSLVKLHKLTDLFKGKDQEMRGIVTMNYEEFVFMAMSV